MTGLENICENYIFEFCLLVCLVCLFFGGVCVCFIPDCPGGGIPDGTLGRYSSTVRTPALLPQHGSMAIGFGTACTHTQTSIHTQKERKNKQQKQISCYLAGKKKH